MNKSTRTYKPSDFLEALYSHNPDGYYRSGILRSMVQLMDDKPTMTRNEMHKYLVKHGFLWHGETITDNQWAGVQKTVECTNILNQRATT
jgi:hypothetical protein